MSGQEKHPHSTPIPSPDPELVRQYDLPEMRQVPVRIDSIVYSQQVPARYSSEITVLVDTLANIAIPNEVIPADPKLKRVWLSCDAPDSKVFIGAMEQVTAPNGPQGFALPQSKPMEWQGFTRPRYAVALAGTAGGPFHLSLHFEYWAD